MAFKDLFKFFTNKQKTQKTEETEEMAMCSCGNMCKASDIEAEKAKQAACCDTSTEDLAQAQASHGEGASVKVLGSGCQKCNDLEAATAAALESLGMDTTIEHVRDFAQISSYGVMSTPALVVDGKVVSYGKVLQTAEVTEILKKARA
ncbi:thioredoxin family protein [Candidatus Epulonipiscium viviparus]|uniref:thioredoxin family protein n=1 Tax=Candidatus Epulonipiscium viviparus TaxID=420336 RepID=UPI002ED299E6